mgnify:CR=1 FL=1
MVQRPFPILDRQGPFLLDPLQSQIQDFQNRLIVRKRAAGLEQLAQAEVE